MRQSALLVLVALLTVVFPAPGVADQERCAALFPNVAWQSQASDGPATVATTGMTAAMAERFAANVARVSSLVQTEMGGLEGTAVCLATPEQAPAFSEFVARGQRLHVGVFAVERVLVLSAVEIRTVDDAIAFGLPQIALWHIAGELGRDDGYPEPLGSTIAHWYLARETDRLDRYRSELVVTLFLDDPNPEQRTLEDALPWVGETKPDPFFFDPQFVGSQLGVFVDFAVSEEGTGVLRDLDQATWAELERRWRISIRDQFPRGDYGVWWGVAIVVVFLLLAVYLAWSKRRANRRAAQRKPSPPPDESLFTSP